MKHRKYKRKYDVYDINKVEHFFVDISFGAFCNNNFALIGILALILIVVLAICFMFTGKSENFSTMVISILTSALIYVGTSILTIAQFFHAWQTQQIDSCNKTIHLDIRGIKIAEESLLDKTDTPTKIYSESNNNEKQRTVFKIEYYNKTNFKIIDFDSLHFIPLNKNVAEKLTLNLYSKESSLDLDNEYKNFECEYHIPQKRFKKLIEIDYRNFIIISVFTDEFFEDYYIRHCFKLIENDFILSSQVLKEAKYYKEYGTKINKRFVKKIYKTFNLED